MHKHSYKSGNSKEDGGIGIVNFAVVGLLAVGGGDHGDEDEAEDVADNQHKWHYYTWYFVYSLHWLKYYEEVAYCIFTILYLFLHIVYV